MAALAAIRGARGAPLPSFAGVPGVDTVWPGTLVSAPYPSSGVEAVSRPGVCTGEKRGFWDLLPGGARPGLHRDGQLERSPHLEGSRVSSTTDRFPSEPNQVQSAAGRGGWLKLTPPRLNPTVNPLAVAETAQPRAAADSGVGDAEGPTVSVHAPHSSGYRSGRVSPAQWPRTTPEAARSCGTDLTVSGLDF